MRARILVLIPIIFLIFMQATPAAAGFAVQPAFQTCTELNWGLTSTRSFSYIYQDAVPLGREIAERYATALDDEFIRFANLFETSLPQPISVRIYPNERDYYCFNPLAPQIRVGELHSRVGSREIALIAQNILGNPARWEAEGLDNLRHELAVLFVAQITNERAPRGLAIGMGVYAEDPFITFERRMADAPAPADAPAISWRALWENPDIIARPEQNLQAASIVAYLIDVYGWDRFLEFINTLATADGYRDALNATYPIDAGALETQWANEYYALYFAGRWRGNVFYNLSLTPYEQLIEAGAYQAAADGLTEVIDLLIALEDFESLTQAQTLNIAATAGLEADAVARQAQQAYREADFVAARDFAAQARAQYDTLGDTRNRDALITIEAQAAEVLTLRAELDAHEANPKAGNAARIAEIGARLGELRDETGLAQAQTLLDTLNARRQLQALWFVLGAFIVIGLLLWHRIAISNQPPPPEAMLGM